MMFKKNALVSVLVIALFLGAVGIGVHMWYKDAMASTIYRITFRNVDPPNQAITDLDDVQIQFETSTGWTDWFPMDVGDDEYKYEYTALTDWRVDFEDDQWMPFDPNDSPADFTAADIDELWEIER